MPERPRPRVLLADDHPGILAALARLLEPSCDVVGHVSDGAALLDAALSLTPDVVVVDIAMPNLDGLEACRRIKDAFPSMQVVILTADTDVRIKEAALASGAFAFVSKGQAVHDLIPAVHGASAV